MEDVGVLQEKLTLLGEKETESSQVDLLLIRFNLGKVCVDGQIQGDSRSHSVLGVKTHLRHEVNVIPLTAYERRRQIGFDIKTPALLDSVNASKSTSQ